MLLSAYVADSWNTFGIVGQFGWATEREMESALRCGWPVQPGSGDIGCASQAIRKPSQFIIPAMIYHRSTKLPDDVGKMGLSLY